VLRSGRREYGVLVESRLADGTLALGHASVWITGDEAAVLMPHREVMVRYDPAHPRRVAVVAPQPLAAPSPR
jgi:hypothetical protein